MFYRQIITLLLIVISTPIVSNAQRWSRFKHEATIGLGASNFLGDLGGATTGDGHRFNDFQFSVTRPALSVNYKYRFHDRFKARVGFSFGYVAGDDAKANNDSRKNRNLNFRSPIVEFAPGIEWYFLKENGSSSYSIKGMKGGMFDNVSGYLFAGVGLFYFSPQGQDKDGNWVNLSDLNTEGQGLPGAPDDYNRIAVTTPLGFGFNYSINKYWSINFEYGVRMTTTDYIDDVSNDKYYQDRDLHLAEYGAESLALSDKRIEGSFGGGKRGNPDNNDAYMFAFFSISKKFKVKMGSRTRF